MGQKSQKTYLLSLSIFAGLTLLFGLSLDTVAQERFTVQSSARGIENAKQAAQIRQLQVKNGQQDSRLDAVEGDIANISDHAWKNIAQCGIGGGANGAGYKITWNPAGSGTWGCIQEIDPTVKSFAKNDLPTCSAGQVLRSDGTKFICTTSSGTSGFEVDPYVQDFARNTAYTISACAADEVLTIAASRLRCVKTQDLAVNELDPTVKPFAKIDLPVCTTGQVLTVAINAQGVRILQCVTDTDGGYAELDPTVKSFAKTNLPVCAGGEVITTVASANGGSFQCVSAANHALSAWYAGSWSNCNKTCGGGTQTRTVNCRNQTGGIVPDTSCAGTKPSASQPCNTQTCVTYSWYTTGWGSCSKTCGGGTQSRTVYCRSSQGAQVADSNCSGTKPVLSQTCNTQACTACALPWGGTIAHGGNAVAYQTASVPYGSTCASQARNCNNGTLSGSYTNKTCSVHAPETRWVKIHENLLTSAEKGALASCPDGLSRNDPLDSPTNVACSPSGKRCKNKVGFWTSYYECK